MCGVVCVYGDGVCGVCGVYGDGVYGVLTVLKTRVLFLILWDKEFGTSPNVLKTD